MCGRYAASASQDLLVEIFEIDEVAPGFPPPSFNIAPTDAVAAVVERLDKNTHEVVRRLVPVRWGLVPSWSKDPHSGARMINARIETVETKPAFRTAIAQRRCLVPADGYFEWYARRRPDGTVEKQPFFVHPQAGRVLAMAGIYEFWRSPDGAWLSTCAILTRPATEDFAWLHDRMPVMVSPEVQDAWLDPKRTDGALDLLSGHDVPLRAHAVSKAVNSVRNDNPHLVDPLPTE